jgi:large subunit ribosomal protein L27
MATVKSAGTTKNGRDSNPRYLGVKLYSGETAQAGSIIIRQKSTKFTAGEGTDMGKDYTIFALKEGKVSFKDKRAIKFNGEKTTRKVVEVR